MCSKWSLTCEAGENVTEHGLSRCLKDDWKDEVLLF